MHLRIRYTLLAVAALAVTSILLTVYVQSSIPTLTLQDLILWGGHRNGDSGVGHNRQGRYHSNNTKHNAPLDLMPQRLRELALGLPVVITATEFRQQPGLKTGNPLIDTYGDNDVFLSGEKGRGVTFVDKDRDAAMALQREFSVNVMASDLIPLNRMVPDARLDG